MLNLTELPGLEDDLAAVPPEVSDEWLESEDATASFISVATNPSKWAGTGGEQGVEVIGIPSSTFTVPQSSAPSKNIVSRPEQREVIQFAFNLSREENLRTAGVCIALRGSPGIGKSWSALLYIRLLMIQKENRRPIIYEMGTSLQNRTTYLIYPKKVKKDGDEGKAWTVYTLGKQEKVSIVWMRSKLVDFVIDPPQFSSGADPQPSALIGAAGHTFIPASTDSRHLGGGDKVFFKIFELVLGPFTLDELEYAFPFMMYSNPAAKQVEENVQFENAMSQMREKYKLFGGLPRYLLPGNWLQREVAMTTANARKHKDLLIRALSEPWLVNKDIKIASLFFTLRPGLDGDGNRSHMRKDSFVEFVSPGAVKTAGKVVYDEIQRRVTARTQEDSSQIGLAFEHVGLMLLRYGTDGLRELGISARCKELKKDENPQDMEFVAAGTTSAQFERCEDKTKFESLLKTQGQSLEITPGKLSSKKAVVLSPTGYSNVDGMYGIDVGLQMTLRENHIVLGYQLANQRGDLGLGKDDEYALIFVVPPERFGAWNSFQNLSWKDDARAGKVVAGSAKRRRLSPEPPVITESKKKELRKTLRQFVVTLDITPDNVIVAKVSTGTRMLHPWRYAKLSSPVVVCRQEMW